MITVNKTYTCTYEELPYVLNQKLGLSLREALRPYHRDYTSLLDAVRENKLSFDDLNGDAGLMEDADSILASPYLESFDGVLGTVKTKWNGPSSLYYLDKIVDGMSEEARNRIVPYVQYSIEDLQQLLNENTETQSVLASFNTVDGTICLEMTETINVEHERKQGTCWASYL